MILQAAQYMFTVRQKEMFINDLALQQGQNVIANLKEGNNSLRYYSIDANKNVEVVKQINILACKDCQGPKAIKVNVTPANYIGGKYYTRSLSPKITVEFNEPAQITAAGLTFGITDRPLLPSAFLIQPNWALPDHSHTLMSQGSVLVVFKLLSRLSCIPREGLLHCDSE